MNDCKILLTGDFWHPEFKALVSGLEGPTTLVPIEKIETVAESVFDLVIVAQSRRGQYSAADIEKVQGLYPSVPVIGLLGSWCEGETRSGNAWPGVQRIFWHQWEGRFDAFKKQLAKTGVTDWHAPRTSSVGDLVVGSIDNLSKEDSFAIAISAWTAIKHEMIEDAVQSFGWTSCWVERAVWDDKTITSVDAICIEADSWNVDLVNRVKWIRSELPNKPMVLVLNYPRQTDAEEIQIEGISAVVSKPFELNDLQSAIYRAITAGAEARLDPAHV